jgi:molecular chaperone GrpE
MTNPPSPPAPPTPLPDESVELPPTDPTPLSDTVQRLLELEAQVADLTKKSAEFEVNWKRASADLANFRRQAEDEKQAFAKFASERTLLAMLPVYDNFERANSHLPPELAGSDFATGLTAIKAQFEQALRATGAEPVETPVGSICDPAACQAIGMGPGAKDAIIDVFEIAWKLGGKIIRTAKVRVGDGTQ